jgi:hypothetical protein
MSSPCNDNVMGNSDLNKNEAEQLLQRLQNKATLRAQKTGQPMADALRDIAGEMVAEEKIMASINKRNALLFVQAKRNVKAYVGRFGTMGEGVRALLEGSNKVITGARRSIDYQSKSIHGKYFGRLVADLEEAGVIREFKKSDPEFVKQVYQEMGAMHPGEPAKSVSGNDKAFKVAQAVDDLTAEMVARQNRAGAFIRRLPGYIIRQTHDQMAIRKLGDLGNNQLSKEQSFQKWSTFIRPLLDEEKSFEGADPMKTLRNIHEGLYSGVHGAPRDEENIMGIGTGGSLANKVSRQRLLHFKDSDSAFTYNQAFGQRQFKEAVLQDIHTRARSIALMENLGPSPDSSFQQIIRELQEEARTRDDADKQVDSLRSWRIKAAYDEVTGRNAISANPSFSNLIGTGKTILQLAKMGSVTLSSLADKAFIQSELAHQGISNLEILGKQLTGMAKRSGDELRMLRMMGVAMDGLIGNSLSRYTAHSQISGWAHAAQKRFFDLNGLNLWTDANKASVAELMSHHLGDNSHLPFEELPQDLRKMLSLYDIKPSSWDALRSTVFTHNDAKFITPDKVSEIPPEAIQKIVEEDGRTASAANIQRMRDQLETSLRTYITDRVDIAVPTPGAGERKFATWGTQAGTPLGEAVRLMMLFKSFPTTIMRKVVGRTIYGNGAMSVKQWLLNDHRGKFNLAMLMAMGTVAGYVSGVARDALKGKSPKPLVNEDGSINTATLNDAALRGGSLGILGDVLMSNYDHDTHSFLESAAGPVLGQLNTIMDMKSRVQNGQSIAGPAGKLLTDNTPFINLFYIRPVLDYFILWNLQEMMTPGSLRNQERFAKEKYGQDYFVQPSETVNR